MMTGRSRLRQRSSAHVPHDRIPPAERPLRTRVRRQPGRPVRGAHSLQPPARPAHRLALGHGRRPATWRCGPNWSARSRSSGCTAASSAPRSTRWPALAIMAAIGARHMDEAPAERMRRFGKLGTIDLRVDYLRPAIGERFVVEGRGAAPRLARRDRRGWHSATPPASSLPPAAPPTSCRERGGASALRRLDVVRHHLPAAVLDLRQARQRRCPGAWSAVKVALRRCRTCRARSVMRVHRLDEAVGGQVRAGLLRPP